MTAGDPLLYREHGYFTEDDEELEEGSEAKRLRVDPAYRRQLYVADARKSGKPVRAASFVMDDYESLLSHVARSAAGLPGYGELKKRVDCVKDVYANWCIAVCHL